MRHKRLARLEREASARLPPNRMAERSAIKKEIRGSGKAQFPGEKNITEESPRLEEEDEEGGADGIVYLIPKQNVFLPSNDRDRGESDITPLGGIEEPNSGDAAFFDLAKKHTRQLSKDMLHVDKASKGIMGKGVKTPNQ